ncbi:MAG: hypothetical protein JNN08_14870 [Bryobacterales bacterium]|nr:hypothetical protein [Bryobacterales bacterium]
MTQKRRILCGSGVSDAIGGDQGNPVVARKVDDGEVARFLVRIVMLLQLRVGVARAVNGDTAAFEEGERGACAEFDERQAFYTASQKSPGD